MHAYYHKPMQKVTNSRSPPIYKEKIKIQININKPKLDTWKHTQNYNPNIKNHIESTYNQPNTLPCLKTHKKVPTNLNKKISKLSHKHMHKEIIKQKN